jgi:hypothetical protein
MAVADHDDEPNTRLSGARCRRSTASVQREARADAKVSGYNCDQR